MEFTDLVPLPLTKNICRTCLAESEKNFMNLQDFIEYELSTVKLIDVLVFLGCIEKNTDDWPQGVCELCTSNAITSYHFKMTSQKANRTLRQIFTSHSSPRMPDLDLTDIINVIHQDHEYDIPLLSNHNYDHGYESLISNSNDDHGYESLISNSNNVHEYNIPLISNPLHDHEYDMPLIINPLHDHEYDMPLITNPLHDHEYDMPLITNPLHDHEYDIPMISNPVHDHEYDIPMISNPVHDREYDIPMISNPLHDHEYDMPLITNPLHDHEYDIPMIPNTNQDIENNLPLILNPFNSKTNILQNKDLTITPLDVKDVPEHSVKPKKQLKEKLYACKICPSTFTEIYGLKYHYEKHTEVRRKLCQFCGKCFHTIGGLKQHLQTHRGPGFKCTVCNKTYKSRQTVREHYRVAHSNNRYAYSCVDCDKTFTAKASLTNHVQIHKAERDVYLCPECPKKYTRARYLRAHIEMHTVGGRVKNFLCPNDDCERKYATKHCLLLHILHSHKNNRPYSCEVCLKSFVTIVGLRKHKEIHNKNNKCDDCGKVCLSKGALKNHIKVHNNSSKIE